MRILIGMFIFVMTVTGCSQARVGERDLTVGSSYVFHEICGNPKTKNIKFILKITESDNDILKAKLSIDGSNSNWDVKLEKYPKYGYKLMSDDWVGNLDYHSTFLPTKENEQYWKIRKDFEVVHFNGK